MNEHSLNPADDEPDAEAPQTPEDVAVLYTWANVHGGKYRDFSASRREYRAQQRHRMVEQQREAELEAARAREEAAADEMEQVRRLEEQARHDEALRAEAEEARRRAQEHIEQERLAAHHHVEVAEELKRALDDAQREMEEARRRAEEQAARYAEADARYRASARNEGIPGEIVDPYYYAGPLEPTAFAPGGGVRSSVPQRVSSEKRIAESYYRSKAISEVAHGRGEEGNDSMFSSGQRSRGSSAGHLTYTEMPPASEVRRDLLQRFAEVWPETPEDTRERNRPDELDRLADHHSGRGYDDNEDDGYYDGLPVRQDRSSDPATRNSAPSNVYLQPRVQQAPPPPPRPREEIRQGEESGERPAVRSEDPVPGSPHVLEQGRARRRESAADVQARTTRRPRESGEIPGGADSRDQVRAHRSETPEYTGRSERTPRPESQGRPEWLVREASSSPRGEVEQGCRDDRTGVRRVEDEPRDARQYEQRSTESRTRRSETHRAPAEPYVEDRIVRREPPSPGPLMADTGDPLPPRPAAERRRTDRPSGGYLTRELHVPQAEPPSVPEAEPRNGSVPRSRASEPEDAGAGTRSAGSHPADTLQQSRERVAARWFALKGLMGSSGETQAEPPAVRAAAREMPVPILTVVSLSGGVGKTSLVATVGRTLSSMGERVLLADAAPHGLLPYYFSARELRPDVVRTFSPPPGSRDATVFMVNYDADRLNGNEAGQAALIEQMGLHVKGAQRLLLDLNGTGAWLARRLAGMNSTILVPVAADMNSVLGIRNVERFFAGLQNADGSPQLPYYILNQFDASLPLHLDVREVLRQQLGDRLLPVMIRRAPSVAEALAEGMTVMDYAPESPVTDDYLQLAEWVRKRSAPAQIALRSTRWSER